ncbi:hypothetical protein PRNP1_002497 [Phytophthora ramorum]
MDSTESETEHRLRAMEAAFQRERQQRDLLEKKYARLKRRYVRLERSHSRLLMESHGKSGNGVETPTAQSEPTESVASTPNSQTSTVFQCVTILPTNPSPFPLTAPSPLVQAVSSPARNLRAESDEEASLALARYLQQQENIAAYEEYEARLLRESAQQEYNQRSSLSTSSALSGLIEYQRNVDPDNMTYEELLRLGEEVGDVKKERWRRMAVQVLSSLPTHRWTRDHSEDLSCIICQYNFVPNDRAMTLPCAHVFHEDCVGGWIHENNNCPLCKREITAM